MRSPSISAVKCSPCVVISTDMVSADLASDGVGEAGRLIIGNYVGQEIGLMPTVSRAPLRKTKAWL